MIGLHKGWFGHEAHAACRQLMRSAALTAGGRGAADGDLRSALGESGH